MTINDNFCFKKSIIINYHCHAMIDMLINYWRLVALRLFVVAEGTNKGVFFGTLVVGVSYGYSCLGPVSVVVIFCV